MKKEIKVMVKEYAEHNLSAEKIDYFFNKFKIPKNWSLCKNTNQLGNLVFTCEHEFSVMCITNQSEYDCPGAIVNDSLSLWLECP